MQQPTGSQRARHGHKQEEVNIIKSHVIVKEYDWYRKYKEDPNLK